jgi:hypothetical protein
VLLEKAEANDWSRDELREAKSQLKDGKSAADAEPKQKGICPTCGGPTVEVVQPDTGEIILKHA